MEPSISKLLCHVQRNQILLTELKTLKKRHLMIGDAMQMLNIIFSLQLLATVVLSFLIITFELYFFAVRWQDGIFIIDLNRNFLDMLSVTIINNVLKIMLLVWACETGKNQAKGIHTTIHDLLNSTNDDKIKYELFCDLTLQLQLFSLQMLHRENIFAAKGLNIDATLLTT
ncbi:PREDICTED: uncharacterized protein LOC105460466, partial [Wasmannia auropunctata]|uniref:uncharacterized protein LOC105460466 n=1 Tax=Wasmannia auropunctata TaxID=64793 RepID=UPI0005F0355B